MRRFLRTIASLALTLPAFAEEAVEFPSAIYRLSDFQKVRGGVQRPALAIPAYLSKPHGDAKHPAVVVLHGCGGLGTSHRDEAEIIRGWGYVTLVPDSFAPRGMKDACVAERRDMAPRVEDAFGALAYLAKLPFVDPERIAVVGYSHGGGVALRVAMQSQRGVYDMPDDLQFRAAAAYYPPCEIVSQLVLPTLILIGDKDDWTPASLCQDAARRDAGKLSLTVFPGVYHSFNFPVFKESRQIYGHWSKYDEAAATKAAADLKRFLSTELR